MIWSLTQLTNLWETNIFLEVKRTYLYSLKKSYTSPCSPYHHKVQHWQGSSNVRLPYPTMYYFTTHQLLIHLLPKNDSGRIKGSFHGNVAFMEMTDLYLKSVLNKTDALIPGHYTTNQASHWCCMSRLSSSLLPPSSRVSNRYYTCSQMLHSQEVVNLKFKLLEHLRFGMFSWLYALDHLKGNLENFNVLFFHLRENIFYTATTL